jgi:hypothetical protein
METKTKDQKINSAETRRSAILQRNTPQEWYHHQRRCQKDNPHQLFSNKSGAADVSHNDVHPSLIFNAYSRLFPQEYSVWGVGVTNHLHLVPKLIVGGTLPPHNNMTIRHSHGQLYRNHKITLLNNLIFPVFSATLKVHN